MHGRRGCHINRFGEVYQSEENVSSARIDELKEDITATISANETKLSDRIKAFENLISYTKSYVSFNGRRLVNVKGSVDNHDVVTKEELQEAVKHLKELNFTSDEISLVKQNNKRRRISSVEKSKHQHDVVIRKELDDVLDKCYEYQEQMNVRLKYFDDKLKGISASEPNGINITHFSNTSKHSKPIE